MAGALDALDCACRQSMGVDQIVPHTLIARLPLPNPISGKPHTHFHFLVPCATRYLVAQGTLSRKVPLTSNELGANAKRDHPGGHFHDDKPLKLGGKSGEMAKKSQKRFKIGPKTCFYGSSGKFLSVHSKKIRMFGFARSAAPQEWAIPHLSERSCGRRRPPAVLLWFSSILVIFGHFWQFFTVFGVYLSDFGRFLPLDF